MAQVKWGPYAKVKRNDAIYNARKKGMKVVDIARKYDLTESRISTIVDMVRRRRKDPYDLR